MNQATARGEAAGGGVDGTGAINAQSRVDRTVPAAGLLGAGVIAGLAGDLLLRASGPPGLNMFLWIATIAAAAFVLHRRAGVELDRERAAWLVIGVLFAAGLVWRDSPPLKLLALGCATLTFALAAYRVVAAWVRRAGIFRYVRAWGTGALHAWTAAGYVLLDVSRSTRPAIGGAAGWRRATAVVRGLVIALPLILVFGALFMSADAVFADMVLRFVRIDIEQIASHVVLFSICAWLSTGYLRGFARGTELAPLSAIFRDGASGGVPKRPALGITETGTALTAVDLLFLVFVIVQFRYLFGGDALVQVTPDLTYAEYARRGFFELVFAVALVVPVLLTADWLLVRTRNLDDVIFRVFAGVQIALVIAITASALQRLRLYHASYGLTDSRFFAMVFLVWIGSMLLWFAATVLRGRGHAFAFGALVTGLATVALLFVLNPDAVIARTNVARMSGDEPVEFDVSYARSLSADAVPVLIDALPAMPANVQCPLAQHLLRRWSPEGEQSIRSWNWSAWRAGNLVRERAAQLRSMVGPNAECATPSAAG